MRRFGPILFAMLFMLAAAREAPAADRIALLIGNQGYSDAIGRLTSSQGDVSILESALRSVGFTTTVVRDADLASLRRAIASHVQRLQHAGSGTISFFYYAGHAAADAAGNNYLIPVDVTATSGSQLWHQSLPLSEVTALLKSEAPGARHLVVLDNGMKLQTTGPRTATDPHGLAPVEAEAGMAIVLAKPEGTTASDGDSGPGLYASMLAQEIVRPGVDVMTVLRNAQQRVREMGRPAPRISANGLGLVLLPEGAAVSQKTVIESPGSAKAAQRAETDYMRRAKSDEEARRRELEEAQRREEALRRAILEREAAIAALEAERARRVVEEHARLEAERAEMMHRAEMLPAEEARRAVEERELKRLTDELTDDSARQLNVKPLEPVRLALLLQQALVRAGCSPGAADGQWGPASSGALARFSQSTGIALDAERPTAQALVALLAKSYAGCGARSMAGDGKEQLARFADLDAPDIAFVGAPFPVSLALREARLPEEMADQAKVRVRPAPGSDVGPDGRLVMGMPAGRDGWDLDVDLTASGFTPADGIWTRRIRVPREGDSETARFVLTPVRMEGLKDARRWLSARLYHEGRFLGSLSRPIDVRERVGGDAPQQAPRSMLAAAVLPATAAAATSNLVLAFGSEVPDLDVFIEYDNPDQPGAGRITIRSPHFNELVSDRFSTAAGLQAWLDHEYARLVEMGLGVWSAPASKEQTIPAVRAIGRTLWREYVPEPLKAAILKLGATGKLESLQITSNSPLLPWEIALPDRSAAGSEPEFLGIAYRLGRWSPRRAVDQLNDPVKDVVLRELHAVAPDYEGKGHLPFQKQEVDSLRAAKGFHEHRGDFATLKRLMRTRISGFFHFTGHGDQSPPGQGQALYSIQLVDALVDPQTWSELASGKPDDHPFFFFNACDTGRGASFGGFVQGWGPVILGTGAGGFIGGLWPLLDRPAAEFAGAFYGRIIQPEAGAPPRVADILKQVRRRFYASGDPTFLAYAFFGDANLRVSLPTD